MGIELLSRSTMLLGGQADMILSEGDHAPEVQRDTAMIHLRHTCLSCEVFWKQLHPKNNKKTYGSTILPSILLIDMVFLNH